MKNPIPSTELQAFEKLCFEQKPWALDKYDDEYFVDDWREGPNNYELENRRKIEGKNPELIKEVFETKSILDCGCGPGILMTLLHELGVDAHGVDGAPSSLNLAPESVKDRIKIGPVTKLPFEDNSMDLCISREVFEHLTILQVQRAVQEMARVTSKFIYVTTRFHHDPQSVFNVETDFETDPTHITLLNKDMLRSMFTLQGMKWRPDLEERMDWLKKGRCLVYEKQDTGF